LAEFDENDPESMARFMKKMGDEIGEDIGDDMAEAMEAPDPDLSDMDNADVL
jgi:hypothetical protein